MKVAQKSAAAWLITLGLLFVAVSTSELFYQNTENSVIVPVDDTDFPTTNPTNQHEENALASLVLGIPNILLGGWLVLGLYHDRKKVQEIINQQKKENLQSLFYQILQENYGRVTILGFAMKSQLSAADAKQYLDEKAKEFNANFQVSESGTVLYHFEF